MGITRTTLLGGPAAVGFAGRTFFAEEGILVSPGLELAVVDSDSEGVLDESVSAGVVAIKFTPSAPFADLVALFPWTMAGPGTSLFGAVDSPLVLTAANGVRLTFAAAAIVQMPDLHLSSGGAVAGAVTFLARGARSLALTAANRLVAFDAAVMPVAASGTAQLTDDFAITWGAAPWVNLRARDGVRVRFVMGTRRVVSDANALLDVTLERLEVQVAFTPASPGGPGEAEVMAALDLQGVGALPGRSMGLTGERLVVAGEHVWVELPVANLWRGALVFDAVRPRVGELVFVGERAVVGDGVEGLVGLSEGGG